MLILQFWNVAISLHFNLAFSQCSTSIYQAFDGQTEFSRVINFVILSYLENLWRFDAREKCFTAVVQVLGPELIPVSRLPLFSAWPVVTSQPHSSHPLTSTKLYCLWQLWSLPDSETASTDFRITSVPDVYCKLDGKNTMQSIHLCIRMHREHWSGFPWLSRIFLCEFCRTLQDHLCPFSMPFQDCLIKWISTNRLWQWTMIMYVKAKNMYLGQKCGNHLGYFHDFQWLSRT